MCCSLRFLNPILHTVWLDSHAWTLKNYTAKYYEVRKIWFLAYLTNFLSSIEENCSHVYIVFNCYNTVGATRLARTTALARSLSNTKMEMFYKHFRLEISTDWNSAFIQQISRKKIWNLFLEVVQNSVWNYFSEILPFFFTMAAWGQQTIFKPTKHISPQFSTILTSPALFRMCSREKFFI